MTAHVGEVTTELVIEQGGSPRPGQPPAKQPAWVEREKHRTTAEAVARACARLAAEGFDGARDA